MEEKVILATALVRLRVGNKLTKPIRALCDTGSQPNMISENCVKELSLPTFRSSSNIAGFSSNSPITFDKKVEAWLVSRFKDEPIIPILLTVVPNILLQADLKVPENIKIPAEIIGELADPQYQHADPVSLLLGAGVWSKTVQDQPASRIDGLLIQKMSFGWIIFGSLPSTNTHQLFANAVETVNIVEEDRLEAHLQRFWEIDDVLQDKQSTPEQIECEEHFSRTHCRDQSGRYVVRIPMKTGVESLGSSREIALRRFYQLERRLQANDALREKYIDIIRNYQELGHLQLADRLPTGINYYVPHHCVLKKFRVVFDGSCRTSTGLSFNEMQMVGGRLQDDLIDLIVRFRWNSVAITADVKQMYRQVKVHQDDWDLQRIFWREGPTESLNEYCLTVVTFGMASAPFCAIRAMRQCAIDNKSKWPEGARVVLEDFYVDDGITGAATPEAARQLRIEMQEVLRAGGFELSKWKSNCESCLDQAADLTIDNSGCALLKDTTVLGLKWFPESDELAFKVQPFSNDNKVTKRSILSCVAQLYDPIGYLGPTTIIARIILQNLWRRSVGWDTPVPTDVRVQWETFSSQLPAIGNIRIPRWMNTCDKTEVQVHGFADASEVAYGAVVYLRVNENNTYLVASKSRVAPVKVVSIPRLELCAAKLLGKLVKRIKCALRLEDVRTVLWSDSTIVLHWIRKLPTELKTFVGNRVSSIQWCTKGCEWRHVPTIDNPADLLSRGIEPAVLQSSEKWWQGPEWLRGPFSRWPVGPKELDSVTAEHIAIENRQERPFLVASCVTLIPDGEAFLNKMSSLERLTGTTAFVHRAVFNFKLRKDHYKRKVGPITPVERVDALNSWIVFEQSAHFKSELTAIRDKKPIPTTSQILNLNPIVGPDNLLRVGGRLKHSDIPYDQKHQIILPPKGRLAQLFTEQAHRITLHGGAQQMMNYVRQRYWIGCLRQRSRTVVSRCIECTRQTNHSRTQLMGSLPEDRVRPCKAFLHSGVDFAGPFLIRARAGRSKITEKAYVAVFVCMVSKAVHLEVVADLSTAAFIRSFQRFTSTRGRCERLWSDNATNFVGAERVLQQQLNTWSHNDLEEQLSGMGTSWNFITPAAPYQGGLWEAAVKGMKHHLRRVMGTRELTYEMLDTLIKQIAGCMNSRPLTALSDDADDIQALTPAHFLMAEPVVQPPGPCLPDEPRDKLQIWLQVQHMVQSFWKRWRADYLNQLQQRSKWTELQENLMVGQLVLIRSDQTPPTAWPIGRVTEIHPGDDGLVRNVTVRTPSTTLVRPIQKLIVLPIDVIGAERPRAQDVEDIGCGEPHQLAVKCPRSRSLLTATIVYGQCICVCTATTSAKANKQNF